MMNGYYIFRQNGKEIARSKNIITNKGKQVIANALSNQYSSWAGQIAVGSDTTAATASDLFLGFEFTRGDVRAISSSPTPATGAAYSGGTIRITAKAVLEQAVSGQIKEIGLFSQRHSAIPLEAPIFFTTQDEPWTYESATGVWTDLTTLAGSFATGGFAGADRIAWSPITNISNQKSLRFNNSVDLSQILFTDKIALAAELNSTTGISATAASVTGPMEIRFYTDESNYFSATPPIYPTSKVATIPTGTTGTSLAVTSGEGVKFPQTPFYAAVGSEIISVTAISTDTLTIVRAQSGSTARTMSVGDTIYVFGYDVISATKSLWTKTGSPGWDEINWIEINYSTTSTIPATYIDAMRIINSSSDDASIMVSRSVLATGVPKIEGTPLEIEYYVDIF